MAEESVGPITYDECRLLYRQLGREAFRARFFSPVLIECRPIPGRSSSEIGAAAQRAAPGGIGSTRLYLVRQIRKRSGDAPLQGPIRIGSSPTADVSLPMSVVSPRHGYFECAGDGTWTLTDVGSDNGTATDDASLVPGVPRIMTDYTRVHLGGIEFLFCSQEGFVILIASELYTAR
jgi:pSer/pThr/pTyr-binding forkhead associated (FHA) protein